MRTADVGVKLAIRPDHVYRTGEASVFSASTSRPARPAVDPLHIDILTANFVLHPDSFDVVVASNLFGDTLSALKGRGNTSTLGKAIGAALAS